MELNEATFDKVISDAQGKQEAPAPVAPPAPEPTKQEAQPVDAAKPTEKTEWDGDVNKLPPELQDWAKQVQRSYTKRAMADSDFRRLGQEFQEFQNSEDWKSYQQWKQNPVPVAKEPSPLETTNDQKFAAKWEEALLDYTGTKAKDLIASEVEAKIQQAVQLYGNELQHLRKQQQLTQYQQVLKDFADANPDVIDLHSRGILKPFIDEEFASKKHKTYESVIATAHKRAAEVRDAMRAEALEAQKKIVAEKKSAITQTGTSTGDANTFIVDNKEDAFNAAFNFAAEGKKVKVKSKK